jgi:hypothetical protein
MARMSFDDDNSDTVSAPKKDTDPPAPPSGERSATPAPFAPALREPAQNAIDTEWFRGRISDRRTSARQLAFQMKIDPAAMSLMLRGKRKMTVLEAAELAELLGADLEEVMRRAGAAVMGGLRTPEQIRDLSRSRAAANQRVARPMAPRGPDSDAVMAHIAAEPGARLADGTTVEVRGWVDGHGVVHFEPAKGPGVVERPPGVPAGSVALRLQTEDLWDGWLAFYRPADSVTIDAVGQMCVVELESGETRLRFVSRDYEPGKWAIGGALWEREEGVVLRSASPVLWLKQR